MFSNAGFQVTSDQSVPDALVDALLVSGNEATISARLRELLEAGLDELLVTLAPVSEAGGDEAAGETNAFNRSTIKSQTPSV